MSGTGDSEVSVSFGGSTGEFEAACQRAVAAMQSLTAGVGNLTTALTSTTQGLNATTPAMNAASAAAAQASSALNQVASASRTTSAEVQATVNAFAGMTQASKSAADSAEVFRQALGDQTNEVKALRAQFDETSAAAGRAGHASGGVTRELIVLGHEAMMGNFSRFGGSLIVMAELMGNVSAKTIAAGGAIALAAVAAYRLYENFRTATVQAQSLAAQMALMGRDPEATAKAFDDLAAKLRENADVGSMASREIADQFMRLRGGAVELRAKLAELVPALQMADGSKSVEEVATSFAKTAQSVSGIRKFLEENNLLVNVGLREQIAGFEETNNLAGAQALLLERVNTKWGGQAAEILRVRKEMKDFVAQQAAWGAEGMPVLPQEAPAPPPKPKMTESAESPEDAHLDEVQTRLNAQKREEAQLDEDILGLRQRLAATSDEEARKSIENALAVAEARRAQLQPMEDASWLPKQEEALAAQSLAIKRTAASSKEATAAILANEEQFWQKQLAGDELNGKQREQAQQQLARVQTQIADEGLRARDAAAAAAANTARKSTAEQISELSAQQAANRENYTQWMALEQQKLAILRAAYGEKSKQFQDELRAEETYEREHVARLQAMELQAITQKNALGEKSLSQKVSQLSAEVSQQLRTKDDELQAERALTEAEREEEVKRLALFIGTLAQGTDAFEKSRQRMLSLEQGFANKLADIDKRIAASQAEAARRAQQSYTQAFDRIGSEGQRVMTGLITGTETWKRAEQQVVSSVLSSFIGMASHEAATWAAKEFANSAISTTQSKIRIAQAQMEGNSGLSAIAAQAMHWAAMQLGMTTEQEAQGAARKVEQTTDATAGAAAASAAGLAQIKIDASVAAAGAYAATAAIPVTGPEAAPAAAAAAYSATMAYGAAMAVPSFDVGAWNLPSDMLAMVHKGEMILPANVASQVRAGAGAGISGGGGGGDVHFHINAIDTGNFQSFLNAQGGAIARTVMRYTNANPSARPSW